MPGSSSHVAHVAQEPQHQWDNYVPGSVWSYAPNNVAPLVGATLFFLTALAHIWQTMRRHSWEITIVLPLSCILMSAGLAVREAGAYDYENTKIMIASQVLLLSGPPCYAAADYIILGRTLYYIPWLSPIYPSRVFTTFIGVAGLIEALISNGAAKMSDPRFPLTVRAAGADLVKVSLILQALLFACYVALAAIWHRRVKRAGLLTDNLRTLLTVLYISAALITIRCIYRCVEFFQCFAGMDGYVYTHEAFTYIFDGLLMLANSVLLIIWHPSKYFPRSPRTYLATDGVTELEGPGWRDPRKWWVQLIDPIDFYGLCGCRKDKFDFWNEPHPPPADAAEAEMGDHIAARRSKEAATPSSDVQLAPVGELAGVSEVESGTTGQLLPVLKSLL